MCYAVAMCALALFGLFSLIKWGIVDGVANGIVLFVVCIITALAIGIFKVLPERKAYSAAAKGAGATQTKCQCGATYGYKLNKFLLFVFPPKVYADYGVEHLKPWVDPDKEKKRQAKLARQGVSANTSDEPNGGEQDQTPSERDSDK